jgi:hypothetical protein
LLHVETVGAPEQLPLDVARLVSGLVLPMLRKLHREPAARGTVEASEKAFDDAARDDFEAPEACDLGGLEEIGAGSTIGTNRACHAGRNVGDVEDRVNAL